MKRLVKIFLCVILFSFISVSAFSGGTGNVADPYQIETCTELQNISSDLSANYELIEDIDCSSFTGFIPLGNCIGNFSTPYDNEDFVCFEGTFNGNNHSVFDLYINYTEDGYISLFGCTYFADIKNVNLVDVDVSGAIQSTAGIIASDWEGTNITNVHVSGNVTGEENVGGLIGDDYFTNYINCSFTGNIIGINKTGGITGWDYSSNFTNCSFTGNIIGIDNIGGIAGTLDMSNISNSYSISNISGEDYVGGLVGYIDGDEGSSHILNSYSISNISGEDYVGGLVGYHQVSNISNSYSISNISGGDYVGGLVGYQLMSDILNSYFIGDITADYNIGGITGHAKDSNIFSSYSESNSTIGINGTDYVGGIVGYAEDDCLIVGVHSLSNVNGKNYVGGIAGLIEDGPYISICSFSGNVTGTEEYAGGLVGAMSSSDISNSFSSGNILGRDYVGGLVGHSTSSSINNSYSVSNVNGSFLVGGLVGYLASSGSYVVTSFENVKESFPISVLAGPSTESNSIYNSYSASNVSGDDYVGGIVGSLGEDGLNDVFSTSIIIAPTADYSGSIAGEYYSYNETSPLILNAYFNRIDSEFCFSFNNTTTNEIQTITPAFCGAVSDNISYFYSIENQPLDDWDFEDTWSDFCDGSGYPSLGWQEIDDLSLCPGSIVASSDNDSEVIDDNETVEDNETIEDNVTIEIETPSYSGYASKTYYSDDKFMIDGDKFETRYSDKINFTIGSETYLLTIQNFNTTTVKIKTSFDSLSSLFGVNTTYELDVTGDNVADIRLIYNGRDTFNRVNLFVQGIAEKPIEEATAGGNPIAEDNPMVKEVNYLGWIYLFGILVLVGAGYLIFNRRIADLVNLIKK